MAHNFENLKQHILALSEAKSWEDAKHEWKLDHVQVLEVDEECPPETCPCGHFPIVEMCWIRNQKNSELTFVGNVCVRRFMGMEADAVAAGFKRVMLNRERALNVAATKFAYAQGWITEWVTSWSMRTFAKGASPREGGDVKTPLHGESPWRAYRRTRELQAPGSRMA